jgi:hypothetical protein
MAHGICELLWLKVLLKELEYDYKEFMRLYCNRKPRLILLIIQFSMIEIDRHFIKEKLCAGLICTPYVKTMEQLVDVLTKGAFTSVLHSALYKLGM